MSAEIDSIYPTEWEDRQMKLVKSMPKRRMLEILDEARKLFHRVGLALLVSFGVGHAGAIPQAPQVGDTYQVTLVKDSAQQGSNGSNGTSHDHYTLMEQVIGVRSDGLELQYDLPSSTPKEERTQNWQFPARVFKPVGGPARLLNGSELEARLDSWLKAASVSRTACGHWIFTWNAFRIECDPQSVLKTVEHYDLRSADLHEGALYRDSDAGSPGKLARKAGGADGETFAVEMPVDPDAVRRARAESDVILGEIMKKPVSLETALHERAEEVISGTISVAFETNPGGNARRRTRVTKLDIERPDGRSETQIVTETLERRPIARRD
jgi:hypothetical protein